jgi:hypothetical protein
VGCHHRDLEHRVGSVETKKNKAREEKTWMKDMPKIVDVDEIHMPDYDPTNMWVEEEQNPTHEVGQPEEDTKEQNLMHPREKGHNRMHRPWVQCNRA